LLKLVEKKIDEVNVENENDFFHPDLLVMSNNNEAPYLLGFKCEKCSKIWFPKVERCPSCWNNIMHQIPLSRVGKLYSYSVIHIGQKGIKTPYVIGYVDLPENIRIFAQIDIDPKELKIDMDVEMTVGLIRVIEKPVLSYKFKACS
jgi:benzoylsuccinyl-CoA thiolase BbsA subunit